VKITHYNKEGKTVVFPNLLLFASRHSYLEINIFGGTPNWFNSYKDQDIIAIGGTLNTNWRHPGWEPLFHRLKIGLDNHATNFKFVKKIELAKIWLNNYQVDAGVKWGVTQQGDDLRLRHAVHWRSIDFQQTITRL